MTADVLIVSDRFPSTIGAGAESVLSALCALLGAQCRSIDFVVNQNDLIKVRFESPPKAQPNLHFFRGERDKSASGSWAASSLVTRQSARLVRSDYRKVFVFGDDNIIRFADFGGDLIAWPDDPPYLVSQFKSGCPLLPLRSRMRSFARGLSERHRHARLVMALRRYTQIVHHAHHHASQFGKESGRPVLYAPPLVPSMLAAPTHARPASASVVQRKRGFMHVGHLGGAASLAALQMLLSEPVRKHFAASSNALTMVGKADIPQPVKQRLATAGYQLSGFVDDLETAMGEVRAIIVPGAYAVGARTRILHALSLGNAVIAHRSCLAGMPELADCAAVHLCSSNSDFVTCLARMEALDSGGLQALHVAAIDFMDGFSVGVLQRWRALFD